MISARASSNEEPPPFVSNFQDLPPRALSWDQKPSEKRMKLSNPPVNIIGCNHSLELILAKADWRARQIQKVNEIKTEKTEQRLKEINDEIMYKNGRAARYAALIELQQTQLAWMKFTILANYIEILQKKYAAKQTIISKWQMDTWHARIIQRAVRQWMKYRIYRKYIRHLKFKNVVNFQLLVRIKRKTKAVELIKRSVRDFRLRLSTPHKYHLLIGIYLPYSSSILVERGFSIL